MEKDKRLMENRQWSCPHTQLSETYFKSFNCETPYCEGQEVRCKQCGIFITTCGCGYNNSASGWPRKRWNDFIMNKRRMKNFDRRYPDLLQNIYRHISNLRGKTLR
jgi:hypothetical protein